MTHIAVDIETLDITATSAVLSIGAAVVPTDPTDEEPRMFEVDLSLVGQIRGGTWSPQRTTSPDTIRWHLMQGTPDLRNALTELDTYELTDKDEKCRTRTSMVQALEQFLDWCAAVDAKTFWGQGYGFDFTILESLASFAAQGQIEGPDISIADRWKQSVSPWGLRDSRTLLKLFPEDLRQVFGEQTAHTAGADAVRQAKAISLAHQKLGVKL